MKVLATVVSKPSVLDAQGAVAAETIRHLGLTGEKYYDSLEGYAVQPQAPVYMTFTVGVEF